MHCQIIQKVTSFFNPLCLHMGSMGVPDPALRQHSFQGCNTCWTSLLQCRVYVHKYKWGYSRNWRNWYKILPGHQVTFSNELSFDNWKDFSCTYWEQQILCSHFLSSGTQSERQPTSGNPQHPILDPLPPPLQNTLTIYTKGLIMVLTESV